jgi:hypothetical protein
MVLERRASRREQSLEGFAALDWGGSGEIYRVEELRRSGMRWGRPVITQLARCWQPPRKPKSLGGGAIWRIE